MVDLLDYLYPWVKFSRNPYSFQNCPYQTGQRCYTVCKFWKESKSFNRDLLFNVWPLLKVLSLQDSKLPVLLA